MADFFCFIEVKLKPADLLLSQSGLITNLKGVARTSNKNKPATTFWWWMDHGEQYVPIGTEEA
jgi:hypothetical protein